MGGREREREGRVQIESEMERNREIENWRDIERDDTSNKHRWKTGREYMIWRKYDFISSGFLKADK